MVPAMITDNFGISALISVPLSGCPHTVPSLCADLVEQTLSASRLFPLHIAAIRWLAATTRLIGHLPLHLLMLRLCSLHLSRCIQPHLS